MSSISRILRNKIGSLSHATSSANHYAAAAAAAAAKTPSAAAAVAAAAAQHHAAVAAAGYNAAVYQSAYPYPSPPTGPVSSSGGEQNFGHNNSVLISTKNNFTSDCSRYSVNPKSLLFNLQPQTTTTMLPVARDQ